ncbi:uncharacterized protein Z519_04463 [Cladophialophora bantiana CBS 173.52]|uniref:Uncharacterized protein n=1 Tax=Cladophialophora bantiana (strain ATCC 10958 / CBS 173.52 / CDC B-1940 / NIH 8579) TaxID=1442370 RepID=A0A0D2G795_CLAB1|nr:uncharacterized protein Z519_04463 [Cladophialophora bantiana CBS 173.52]KIW94487.1 hypothetical protein Z519_04463 [Cladophialophora bantiana CBS 173.52]
MASSAGLTPLPTSVHHSTTRLTHSEAHSFLSAFLDRAENDAAYRPDSTLTERGPQALSSGSTPNLTLSHLKRILSGMEGKRIGGSLELEKETEGKGDNTADEDFEGSGESDQNQTPRKRGSQKRPLDEDDAGDADQQAPKSKKQKRKIVYSLDAEPIDDPTDGAVLGAETPDQDQAEDGWQDAETYALAQTQLDDSNAARTEHKGGFDGDENAEQELETQESTGVNNASAVENMGHTPGKKRKLLGGDEGVNGDRQEQKVERKNAKDPDLPERTAGKSNQELSKEERKKMKKMRRKDEQRERQQQREQRNRAR